MDEAFALADNGLFDGRMGVAECRDADAAEKIEVVLAVFVAQIDAVPADEEVRIALVSLEEQFTLRCLNGY